MSKATIYLNAWNETFASKSSKSLESVLDDSFELQNPRTNTVSSKKEHIEWCLREGPNEIADYKMIYEEDGIMIGTHSAIFENEKWLVMYFGKEVNGKLVEWIINSGPVEKT